MELATFGYAIYVDGTRTVATGVACTPPAAATGFPCTAALPPLTSGAHSLQVASFVNDGGLLESTLSAALQVTVVATTSTVTVRTNDGSSLERARRSEAASSTARQAAGRVELVADGLVDPTDLAFAPDGRLFVAEKAGTVVVVDAARRTREQVAADGSTLLALAIDPDFARTHFVFAIYTEPGRGTASTFTVARFREAAGTLGDRAVLLDRVAAAATAHAALRFGPDGRLYVAFDGGGGDHGADPAAFSGKVLRLNADGTTPKDSRGLSPVIAIDVAAPVGLAWPRGARDAWVVDQRSGGQAQLRETGDGQHAYRLPDGFMPSSLADSGGARGGDLLIGSADSATLLRVRFDPATHQPVATESLATGASGGIRALGVGPGGRVVFATASAVFHVE